MNKYSVKFSILIIMFSPFCNLLAQWNISGDFNGGYVNAILANGQEIYAGSSTQGVFKSVDNGSNWIQINSGLGNSLFVQSLSAKDNYIFAGTASGGVFYSSDKGANWIQSNQGISQLNIKALITDSSNVYAGCVFAGVFRSTNNGLNWSRFGLGEGDLLYALSYNETNFFIGVYGGIYRSTNNGMNWMISHQGLTNLDIRSIVQCANKTYCGTYGGGVFVTENNGILWTGASSGLPELRTQALATYGNNLFAAPLGKGIYYFNFSSGSWNAVNEGLADTNITSIVINDKFIFAGSSTGKVWRRPVSEIITDIYSLNSETPSSIQLYQNYPNPFNPSTVIRYSLIENHFTTLRVYDILGNEIAALVNERQNAGNYFVGFDGSKHASGIYYYKLETGGFNEVMKMTLIK